MNAPTYSKFSAQAATNRPTKIRIGPGNAGITNPAIPSAMKTTATTQSSAVITRENAAEERQRAPRSIGRYIAVLCYCSAALISATGKSLTRSPIPASAASAVSRSELMKVKIDPSSRGTFRTPSGVTDDGNPATVTCCPLWRIADCAIPPNIPPSPPRAPPPPPPACPVSYTSTAISSFS